MHLFAQSALLKALGWSLFNSLWQMALLWLVYVLLTIVFRKATAGARHFLALLFLCAGTAWFLFSFVGEALSADDQPAYAFSWVVSRQFVDQFLPWCTFFYLLVLAFLFARYSNHYLHSKRLKLTGLTKIQPELRVFVKETSRLMGIGKEVRVWLSSLVEVPVTLGFLKPVILIPVATVNNLSLQQVETIILHELAHIKRYDYLLNLGITMLELVFFFNPFSRWMIRDIKREREHRCDDVVMQFRYDPYTYISALLSLASNGRQWQQIALAATGRNDQLLLGRVKRILKQKNNNDQPGARPLVFLLFTLLLAFIGLSRSPHPLSIRIIGKKVQVPWNLGDSLEVPASRWAILDDRRHMGNGAPEFPGNGEPEFPAATILRTSDAMTGLAKAPAVAPHSRQRHVTAASPADAGYDLADNIILASNPVPDDDDDPGYEETRNLKLSVAPVKAEVREYSIRQVPASVTLSASAAGLGLPYVASSSFSTGRLTEDTVYSIQQQVGAAEKGAREEMERGMKLLIVQKEVLNKLIATQLYSNLKPLRQMSPREKRPDIRRLEKVLDDEQSKLRLEYLRKQREAIRKLPVALRKKIIIYI